MPLQLQGIFQRLTRHAHARIVFQIGGPIFGYGPRARQQQTNNGDERAAGHQVTGGWKKRRNPTGKLPDLNQLRGGKQNQRNARRMLGIRSAGNLVPNEPHFGYKRWTRLATISIEGTTSPYDLS